MYVLIIKAKDGRTKSELHLTFRHALERTYALEEAFSEYIESMNIYNPSGENIYGVI